MRPLCESFITEGPSLKAFRLQKEQIIPLPIKLENVWTIQTISDRVTGMVD